MSPLLVTFAGEATGQWEVDRIEPVVGEALPSVSHVAVLEGRAARPPREATWILRGSTGHERYVTRSERELLEAVQQPLGRHEATRPALVVRKFERWWGLPQEERRENRGALAPHRHRPAPPAGRRAAAPPLPGARRAVRLPDLVRVRAGRRRLREAGGRAERNRGMELRRARGRHPPRADRRRGAAMTIDATVDTFGELTGEGAVLVDFWGPRCQPCLAMMPTIAELEEQAQGAVRVVKVNAQENRTVCRELRVFGLPTYILMRDGEELERLTGDVTKEQVELAFATLKGGAA